MLLPLCYEGSKFVRNPIYKNILEFVTALTSDDRSARITKMLASLPIWRMRSFLIDYKEFQNLVLEANDLILLKDKAISDFEDQKAAAPQPKP